MHVARGVTACVRPALILVLAAVLAGCGAATDSSPEPAASAAPAASGDVPGALTPAPTGDAPGPTGGATEEPAGPGPTTTPDRSGEPGAPAPADACSGTADNRDFYLAVAEAVEWTVLCAVLPDGWFVDSGSYRLAGGGILEIVYRGPAGAGLRLREGAFCPDATGCVPGGSEIGSADVGPFTGSLIATDGGAWAAVVDRGAPISWLAEVSGLDEASARAILEGLAPVDG